MLFNRPSRRNLSKLTAAVIETMEKRVLLSASISFANPVNYPVGGGPDALVVGDVNGDGIKDIITANYNGTVSVLLGESNGSFHTAVTSPDGLAGGVALAAFASPDLIVASNDQVAILAPSGGGTFALETIFSFNVNVSAIATSPVGGTTPDLFVGFSNGNVDLFAGSQTTTTGGFGPTNTSSTVLTFTSTPAGTLSFGANPVTSLVVGNFGGKNTPEIIAADGSNVGTLGMATILTSNIGSGTASVFGTLTAITATGTTSTILNLQTGDFNGDGTPDILATNYGGGVNVLLGDPNNAGAFLTPANQTITGNISATAIGDVNGDGFPDLAFVDYSTGNMTLLLGNKEGGFTAATNTFTFSGGPDAAQLVDVNGDGRVDLITSNYDSQNVSVRLNASTVAPRFSSNTSTSFVAGVHGSFTLTSVGFPSGVIKQVGSNLPSGVSLVDEAGGDALLEGTPAKGSGKVYTATFEAENNAGTTTQVFTLTVDQPRAFTSAASATFMTTVAGSFNIATSGYPLVTLTKSGALPTGVSFSAGANGTATIAGTPASGQFGTFPIRISAGSGGIGGGPSQNFVLTVDQAPAITSDDTTTFTAGHVGSSFSVVATGFPAATFAEHGALPAGVSLASNGLLQGTPKVGTGGAYPITITATNKAGAATPQVFTLDIFQISSAATSRFVVSSADTFTVTTAGDGADSITLSDSGTLPSGVSFVDNTNGTGTLAGTPSGPAHTYTITLTASNGGVSPDFDQTFKLVVT